MNNESNKKGNKFELCPVCGMKVKFIFVHGHYQCPNCKQVVSSCCENENPEDNKRYTGETKNSPKNIDSDNKE